MRILYLIEHCSTGGMPQYLLKNIKELIKSDVEVTVVEYKFYGNKYIVQRNKIQNLCHFFSLHEVENKVQKLKNIIEDFSPNIVHIQEFSEFWMPKEAVDVVYDKNRKYKIIETSHTSDIVKKIYIPDGFVFVSKYHLVMLQLLDVPKKIVEYPIQYHPVKNRNKMLKELGLTPKSKHILNVGLFTPNKNQGEMFEIAKALPSYCFHFVGNQAQNFEQYWKPLMDKKPSNCIIWGEREDIDKFYEAMDVFLFTSKKELNPIVIKEAIGWGMPILMRNLSPYMGAYDNFPQIKFIDEDISSTVAKLQEVLENFFITETGLKRFYDEINFCYPSNSLGEKQTYKEIFVDKIYDSVENCRVEKGDIVVDVGANVGMFCKFAEQKEASKIIAFEPNVANFECLCKNVDETSSNYFLFRKGMAGKNEVFDLHIDQYSGGHSLFKNKTKTGETEQITCVTLQSIFDDKIVDKIDFLKVDVEGAEKDIFKVLPDKYFKKIKKIAIEWHHNVFNYDDSLNLLLKRLSKWYAYKVIAHGKLDMVYLWRENKIENNEKMDEKEKKEKVVVNYNFVNGPFCEVVGQSSSQFSVSFYDQKDSSLYYSTRFGINHWARGNRKWFTNWRTIVRRNGEIIFDHKLGLKGKRVLICINSKSLGDTIAWFPYIEEFRKLHNCFTFVATFWNDLFKNTYPELRFVSPGMMVPNIYAQYEIGYYWEFNKDLNPEDVRLIPLQKVSSDVLGLEYEEIKPKISLNSDNYLSDLKNYITISEHSTAMCKYWNYPNGWQQVVDYLKSKDISVVAISKEPTKLKNVLDRTGNSINKTMELIKNSKFFIGLGSGPCWLAWSLDVPTILISGWSEKWCEFKETDKNIRIINEAVCHGCMHKYIFDKSNWRWCPTGKNFKCTKSITPEMVIEAIEKIKEF